MPSRATQDEWIMESSDKTWSTGEGNGNLLQYSYLEIPMNSMKRQKDIAMAGRNVVSLPRVLLFILSPPKYYSTREQFKMKSKASLKGKLSHFYSLWSVFVGVGKPYCPH